MKGITNLFSSTVFAGLLLPVLYGNHQYISTPLHVASRLSDLTWHGNKVMQSEKTKRAEWTRFVGWACVVTQTIFILLSNVSPLKWWMDPCFTINKAAFVIIVLLPQVAPLVIGFSLAAKNFVSFLVKLLAKVVRPKKYQYIGFV